VIEYPPSRCLLWVKKQTSRPEISMSALPPKAGIADHDPNVRFVPIADIAVFRSVELIVQPDAHDVVRAADAIASSEAIVQAKPNDVESVVERCVKRRGTESGKGGSYDPHGFGTQIDKLIFDLRAPMLVKQPLGPTNGSE
jgi:hypothetical protein